jgi:hypothetical protein
MDAGRGSPAAILATIVAGHWRWLANCPVGVPLKWPKLGFGPFAAGGALLALGSMWNVAARPAPASRRACLSAQVKACAAKFAVLPRRGITQERAREFLHSCIAVF